LCPGQYGHWHWYWCWDWYWCGDVDWNGDYRHSKDNDQWSRYNIHHPVSLTQPNDDESGDHVNDVDYRGSTSDYQLYGRPRWKWTFQGNGHL
jgi:hypothetical protein